jgi:predicted dinucleotide-utilizing enzyme
MLFTHKESQKINQAFLAGNWALLFNKEYDLAIETASQENRRKLLEKACKYLVLVIGFLQGTDLIEELCHARNLLEHFENSINDWLKPQNN